VLQAGGLLFFAFAGYARIATLGEEVRDPARTIPRAIPLALGIVVALYALVGVVVLLVLGPTELGSAPAPLAAAATAGGADWLGPVTRLGAAVASLGALLAMIAGVGRTTLAMAREHDLPGVLAGVHPRYRVPHRAELALAAVVIILVLTVDLRGAIGFSAFAVLVYYSVANTAALTLPAGQRRFGRWLPILGLLGCLTLAAAIPLTAVLAGLGLFALGLLVWVLRHRLPGSSYARHVAGARTTTSRGHLWCWAVGVWSLAFAAPHFYWAAGGRAGLGSQVAAADVALEQAWFAAYNLAAGFLGVCGAALALALATESRIRRFRRWLLAAAVVASAVLLLRGLVGTALLAIGSGGGVLDGQTPPILLAIEPWFVLGGLAYGLMVREQHTAVPYVPRQ
jgi:amino acid transporter